MRVYEFQFNPKDGGKRIEVSFFEKNKHSLYLIGEAKGVSLNIDKVLLRLVKTIKDTYSNSLNLKESLIKANEFLLIQDSLNWLGNLNLVAISIVGNKIELAKLGKSKTSLISYGQITDLNNESESNSFGKIATGKISRGERLVVLTEEIIDNKTLDQISNLDSLDNQLLEKIIKERGLDKRTGALFILDYKRPEKRPLLEEKEVNFSIKELLHTTKETVGILDRRVLLVTLLITILLIGFLIFNGNRPSELKKMQEEISLTDELINLNREDKAFSVLEDLYHRTIELGNDNLHQEVVLRLKELSKMVQIDEIKPIVSLQEIAPQKIMALNQVLYLYGPLSDEIVVIDIKSKEIESFDLSVKPGSSTIINQEPIFFSRPNKIINLKDDNTVEIDTNDSSLSGLTSFKGALYFKDSDEKEVLKYSSLTSTPEKWLKEKSTDIKSMTVDGSVWILNSNNEVLRYSAGILQDKFSVNIFPFTRSISKIATYPETPIFLLEPTERRVIILNKDGSLLKQIRSESFDNLIDFWVSPEGEVFLLNGSDVYYLSST